jgi:hypothetical protein
MNGNTHTIKRPITGFALAAFVAAFVVSSALASGGPFYSVHTGASTTHTDGSAALMERHFKQEDSLYRNAASTPSQCPCNSGLPAAAQSTGAVVASAQTGPSSQCPCNLGLMGGPRVSIPVAGSSTAVIHQRGGGLGWNDAWIGAGAALGLALIALGIGTVGARAGKDSKMKRDWNIKKRRRLARALERATVPERPFIGRGPRYLVQPSVTAACAPSLQAIATALREESLVLDEDGLRAVLTFISDGTSPASAARRAAFFWIVRAVSSPSNCNRRIFAVLSIAASNWPFSYSMSPRSL